MVLQDCELATCSMYSFSWLCPSVRADVVDETTVSKSAGEKRWDQSLEGVLVDQTCSETPCIQVPFVAQGGTSTLCISRVHDPYIRLFVYRRARSRQARLVPVLKAALGLYLGV